jgi:hypothetical protein
MQFLMNVAAAISFGGDDPPVVDDVKKMPSLGFCQGSCLQV